MRNKDEGFWRPYVEEYEVVPKVRLAFPLATKGGWWLTRYEMIGERPSTKEETESVVEGQDWDDGHPTRCATAHPPLHCLTD
jgi:hypothetical protein